MEILKVENMKVSAFSSDGEKKIIHDLSFSLEKGGSLSVIGGSGAGKTTIAGAVLGLLPPSLKMAGGRIYFRDGSGAVKSSLNGEFMRAHAAFIEKDPSARFLKNRSVKRQLEEVFLSDPKPEIRDMRLKYADKVFREYGAGEDTINNFLHKAVDGINFTTVKKTAPPLAAALLKGGIDEAYASSAAEKIARYCCREENEFAKERARETALFVGISDPDVLKFTPSKLTMDTLKLASLAHALLYKPDVLILDEPLSYVGAVDRRAVINALKKARKIGISLLIFTRDPAVAKELSDDVCIIYRGRMCEKGKTEEVFSSPSHEYTRALLKGKDVLSLSPLGDSFGAHGRKAGCAYAYNCAAVKEVCRNKTPVEIKYSSTHGVFCWSAYDECYKKGLITLKSDEVIESVIDLSLDT